MREIPKHEGEPASLGRLRSLQRLVGRDGLVRVLALDHGDSFVRRVAVGLGRAPSVGEILDIKSSILQELDRAASGVVLDPGGLLEHAISRGLLSGSSGLVAGLPDVGLSDVSAVSAEFPPEVERVARLGCDAVKLCLLVRPGDDLRPFVDLAGNVAERCHQLGIAAIVEPVAQAQADARFGVGPVSAVDTVDLAESFADVGADLLKLGFPAEAQGKPNTTAMEACRSVTRAANGTPWVLLSAGASFEGFARQVEHACLGGAVGFVAGTAIWQEALEIPHDLGRREFLTTTGLERLSMLSGIVTRSGSCGLPLSEPSTQRSCALCHEPTSQPHLRSGAAGSSTARPFCERCSRLHLGGLDFGTTLFR
jgi:tagatose-1,6-bisphosphate aldolase